MLSKAVEIFVTELSLRAWLHTEESKRRTVQVIACSSSLSYFSFLSGAGSLVVSILFIPSSPLSLSS